MKEISKNEKALAIAVKDGWREAQDDNINYWAKVGEQSLYESQLIEKYQTYDALMPIFNWINREHIQNLRELSQKKDKSVVFEMALYREFVRVDFTKFSELHGRVLFTDSKRFFIDMYSSELDALLDAIYYVLCEVKND